ncbi:MAG: hypothetical protein ACJAYU_000595 [Bradymonadia bacterium]
MIRITKGTVHLFTYKEGVLSAIAHDLRLTVKRFRVQVDGANVTGFFMPESITVDGAMKNGKLNERGLSDKDKSKIRSIMAGEVLRTSQFGKVNFTGIVTQEGLALVARGELELVGKKQQLEVAMRRRGDNITGEIEIQPSRWGIKPYRALGGTLKLQDRVRVVFELPAS